MLLGDTLDGSARSAGKHFECLQEVKCVTGGTGATATGGTGGTGATTTATGTGGTGATAGASTGASTATTGASAATSTGTTTGGTTTGGTTTGTTTTGTTTTGTTGTATTGTTTGGTTTGTGAGGTTTTGATTTGATGAGAGAGAGSNCHYILGNHDYYNFSRYELKDLLIPSSHQDVCSADKLYYSFCPFPGHRFVVLDGYDNSIIGAACEHVANAAEQLVRDKNPNYRAGSNDWFVDIPLEDYRYVPYNGGIGEEQLKWLECTIDTAKENQEFCYIFCHQPVHVKASREANLLWNAEDVLRILQHDKNSHVIAFFSGHDHDGGYTVDDAGIHHMIPPAPLECEVGEVAYGVFDVHDDHLHLHWTGKLPPLCVGREGDEHVEGIVLEQLQSDENQRSVHRAQAAPFLALSTPCIWPTKLPFRQQMK
jgi:manganese-dependent ADP-ribose/CDP-alcohol diphosphatase